MIGTEISLLNSKFLAYDPAAKTTSADFSKFSSSRVVFLEDPVESAVFHRLCKELLAASVREPSCLLLGLFPTGMKFAPENIPGWEDLPGHLHIEGADSSKKGSKKAHLDYMHLESLRMETCDRQIAIHGAAMQAIANVLRSNPWKKTKEENHIRVEFSAYEEMIGIHDEFWERAKAVRAELAKINNEFDTIRLEKAFDLTPEEINQDVFDVICRMSTQFSKVFVLWPETLIRIETTLFKKLQERKLEPIVLTPNYEYAAQIEAEWVWSEGIDLQIQLHVETVWQQLEKAFDKTTGTYRPATEIEIFTLSISRRFWKYFPPEMFALEREGEKSSKRKDEEASVNGGKAAKKELVK